LQIVTSVMPQVTFEQKTTEGTLFFFSQRWDDLAVRESEINHIVQ